MRPTSVGSVRRLLLFVAICSLQKSISTILRRLLLLGNMKNSIFLIDSFIIIAVRNQPFINVRSTKLSVLKSLGLLISLAKADLALFFLLSNLTL